MSKVLHFALSAVMAAALAGCGGDGGGEPAEESEAYKLGYDWGMDRQSDPGTADRGPAACDYQYEISLSEVAATMGDRTYPVLENPFGTRTPTPTERQEFTAGCKAAYNN